MFEALIVVIELPSPANALALIVPPTPKPPAIITAPLTVLSEAVVSVNVLTPAILWLPPSLAPATVPVAMLLALMLVSPLASPVNMLLPILIFPNPLVMLPLFKAPVPVILA